MSALKNVLRQMTNCLIYNIQFLFCYYTGLNIFYIYSTKSQYGYFFYYIKLI